MKLRYESKMEIHQKDKFGKGVLSLKLEFSPHWSTCGCSTLGITELHWVDQMKADPKQPGKKENDLHGASKLKLMGRCVQDVREQLYTQDLKYAVSMWGGGCRKNSLGYRQAKAGGQAHRGVQAEYAQEKGHGWGCEIRGPLYSEHMAEADHHWISPPTGTIHQEQEKV